FTVTAGALPAGLALGRTGGLSGTPTAAGTFAFTVTATNGTAESGSRVYALTIAPASVAVLPATLPGGRIGTLYGQTITASGLPGPFTFAVTAGALPVGLV